MLDLGGWEGRAGLLDLLWEYLESEKFVPSPKGQGQKALQKAPPWSPFSRRGMSTCCSRPPFSNFLANSLSELL